MIRTVGDLIRRLRDFDPNSRVLVTGVDCGGYDACWKDDFEVENRPNVYPAGIVRVTGSGEDVDGSGRVI